MATLTLDGVSKAFGRTSVLDRLSLAAADSETIVVFGPSGSGKTVLLRLIAGMHEPDEGAVLIDGEDMAQRPPESRGVGMAFQNFALFPHMSAFENIASPLHARRNSSERVKDGVSGIARLLKIEHVLGHAPRELSNGQKQRTALARALVAGPRILLLDDPLRNVDAKLRFEMRLELPRLLRGFGSTVLYVTQDYKEAMALGDRIAVLIGGRFVQVGTPEEVYLRPVSAAVARLFGDPAINLVDVALSGSDGGAAVLMGRNAVALPGRPPGADRRPLTLGIRPEAIRIVDAGAGGAIPATLSSVTPLNERNVLFLVTDEGVELRASRPSEETPPGEGERIHVALDPASILLFDRETGARLAPAL